MIAQELEVSLHMAFVEARQKRHEFITVEHLLLALLDNPTAAEVLRASPIGPQFHGFVEGHDIAAGTTDVVVTDGFVGNVCLKMLEGVAEAVVDLARYAYKEKLRWRVGLGMLASGIKKIKDVTDWQQYGGAPILGFDRIFIKAHGRSRSQAIANAGKVAAKAVAADLPRTIAEGLSR